MQPLAAGEHVIQPYIRRYRRQPGFCATTPFPKCRDGSDAMTILDDVACKALVVGAPRAADGWQT